MRLGTLAKRYPGKGYTMRIVQTCLRVAMCATFLMVACDDGSTSLEEIEPQNRLQTIEFFDWPETFLLGAPIAQGARVVLMNQNSGIFEEDVMGTLTVTGKGGDEIETISIQFTGGVLPLEGLDFLWPADTVQFSVSAADKVGRSNWTEVVIPTTVSLSFQGELLRDTVNKILPLPEWNLSVNGIDLDEATPAFGSSNDSIVLIQNDSILLLNPGVAELTVSVLGAYDRMTVDVQPLGGDLVLTSENPSQEIVVGKGASFVISVRPAPSSSEAFAGGVFSLDLGSVLKWERVEGFGGGLCFEGALWGGNQKKLILLSSESGETQGCAVTLSVIDQAQSGVMFLEAFLEEAADSEGSSISLGGRGSRLPVTIFSP